MRGLFVILKPERPMHIHEAVFWGIVFFLTGIFLASVMPLAAMTIMIASIALVVGVIAWRHKAKRWTWIASLLVWGVIGGMYWVGCNVVQRDRVALLVGAQTSITGHVVDVRRGEKTQRVTMALDEPRKGKIAITARQYPRMEYGDAIEVQGMVERPDVRNRNYLMKDAIFATMQFPEVYVIAKGEGNPILTWLRDVRNQAVSVYKRALPAKEAALLAGITLGERAEFDPEFKERMANSGTTHLVALSGYNISVVAEAILLVCMGMMRRRAAFAATCLVIMGFVLMAGAEASIVRAAIMGGIVLLARYIGRAHSMRNAIAISACAMVLWNPNVLRYDLGFQLSFLALIGIVYCKPYIDHVIKRKKESLLDWQENLSGTIAAQVMVLPVLLHAVGSFSLTALVSNVLVLAFVPVTMGFGFGIAAVGYIAQPLATIPAWIASLLLRYEIGVIEVLGTHKGLAMQISALAMVIYYVCLGGVMMIIARRKKIS